MNNSVNNTEVKEEVKTEVKPEEKNETTEKKQEVKLSTWKSVIALIFLFSVICVSIYSLYVIKQYERRPTGVLDIEEVKNRPLVAKDIIEGLDDDVKKAVFNYFVEKKDTDGNSFTKYLNDLNNNKKLLLGGIEDGKKFEDIQNTLIRKFNSELDVKEANLSINLNDKTENVFTYSKEGFVLNEELKEYIPSAFLYDGSIIDFEYDDVKVLENNKYEITSYSLFDIKNGNNSSIDNRDKTLVPQGADISYEELLDVLKEQYPDKKEEFDVITYSLFKKDGIYYIEDVKIK